MLLQEAGKWSQCSQFLNKLPTFAAVATSETADPHGVKQLYTIFCIMLEDLAFGWTFSFLDICAKANI